MKNKILIGMFIAYILFFSLGSIIVSDRSFSDMENRVLEQFPDVSAKNIASGDFSDGFEKYMSDQIILKDYLVRLKVAENRILNQSYINGVYFADNDMLIQEYNNPYRQLDINLKYINEFADANTDLNCKWLVVPNACYVYGQELPAYANCYDQKEVMEYIERSVSQNIHMEDCGEELLSAKNEYIFYKTDHHWTMNGAYIGYVKLCEMLDITPLSKDDYDIKVVGDKFFGTQYSNAPMFFQEGDDIIIYDNPVGEYTVYYEEFGEISDSLYNYENLETKDKYTTYLDGNHAYVKILSNSSANESDTNKKLLVVKDSYAHSLLPLLADHYSEIYICDLRYYHDSISELARENEIKDIVFINNLEFISTDNNFLWLY